MCPTDKLHSLSCTLALRCFTCCAARLKMLSAQLWKTLIQGMFWSSTVLQITPAVALQFSKVANPASSYSLTPTLQPTTTSNGHLLKSSNYQTCLAGFLPPLSEASLIAFPPQSQKAYQQNIREGSRY